MASGTVATRRSDQGFTIIELMVAITLLAFAMVAVSSVMFSALKVLSIQKSRTQGNDLATAGIEDLQRLGYNALGLCAPPPGAAPPGLGGDPVILPACASTTPSFGPCEVGAVAAVGAVPEERYVCSKRSLDYTVSRYVAYGDVAHTEKRLAVVVEWEDRGGLHRVAQQSSLRIPSQSAMVGHPPPTFDTTATSITAFSPVGRLPGGQNASDVTLIAKTSPLNEAGDSVVAVFQTVGAGGREQSSISLTRGITDATGTLWTGSLLAGSMTFGAGEQFVVFTAVRATDGKVNSLVKGPLRIENTSRPSVAWAAPTPLSASYEIDAEGNLIAGTLIALAVQTQGVSPDGGVTVTFETQTGAVTLAMTPSAWVGGVCTPTDCQTTWSFDLKPELGYHFNPGPGRYFYFSANQPPPDGGLYDDVDLAATWTLTSAQVTFT